ncbi:MULTISPECIES: DUF3817 domain-containing protein [Brachybacterium]|uniref:DUF3817 domain-containing protein n=1 Tax=Brachybacterium TaxID=43668 RepID=UPI00026C6B11|nr:DUF3817 domain-containing protein [Brachybacterium paraconglomeratum]MDV3295093.1 DUF3817 domain-containing protein [Brachybacterium paraconglomeratum]
MIPAPADASAATPVQEEGAGSAGISPVGRVFAVIALLEALTWAGLLVGMFLKYVTGTTEAGVWLFGRLHGGMFMVYVVMTLVAAVSLRWKWWVALLALLASVPPLVTLPLEIWLRRTGRLARRPRA